MTNVTLITGASSGIGHAVCEKLLAQGHRVIGMARDFSKHPITHEHFTTIEIDFADLATLPDELDTFAKYHADVNNLICCTGYGQFGSLEEFSYDQIQRLMDVNFSSQAYVTRAFLPTLKRNSGGKIIFIGSEAALQGAKFGSIYCASKFALRGFSQALRDECRQRNIGVSIVNPGMIKTGFYNELSFQPGEHSDNHLLVDDVATAVIQILNTPSNMVVDEINLSPMKKVVRAK